METATSDILMMEMPYQKTCKMPQRIGTKIYSSREIYICRLNSFRCCRITEYCKSGPATGMIYAIMKYSPRW